MTAFGYGIEETINGFFRENTRDFLILTLKIHSVSLHLQCFNELSNYSHVKSILIGTINMIALEHIIIYSLWRGNKPIRTSVH